MCVVQRDQCLVVGVAASGEKLHLLLELTLWQELLALRVDEARPKLDVLDFRSAVVVEQGEHFQEIEPGYVDLLLVLGVDTHGLEHTCLDARMLVLEED